MLATLLSVFSHLPLGLLQGIAQLIAACVLWWPDRGMARTVRRNLRLILPHATPDQLRQMTRQAVRQQLMSMAEFLRVWGNPPQDALARIGTVHGHALFEAALQHPKGCMIIVPHYASWEVMNAWINQYAAPVIMYKPDRQADLNAFVLQARSRLNATLVPTDERGVRQIFKALKQGGLTILLPDHLPDASGGLLSPFFGWPVLTSTLASKLIQKTHCQVIVMSCVRQAQDAQFFDIYIDAGDDALHHADLQTSVDALNRSIEALIVRNPTHYHWSYKRFKLTPQLADYYYVDDEHAEQIVQAQRPS